MAINKKVWVVRAGVENEIVDEIKEKSVIAIGWRKMGDVSNLNSREEFKKRYRESYPAELSEVRIGINTGAIYRFAKELKENDYVLVPIKASREILIGTIKNEYRYDEKIIKDYPHIRKTEWQKKVSRDNFSIVFKHAMGSLMTLFDVTEFKTDVEKQLGISNVQEIRTETQEEMIPFHEEVQSKSEEMLADIIDNLDPYDFQELVAELLKALGYSFCKVSEPGPDGGIDIIASTDAFGFSTSKIKVQVKHRKGAADVKEIRELIGLLKGDEKGIFVSTGDFTRQSVQESNHNPNLSLLNRDDFIKLLLENYEKIPLEYQNMIPLVKIYIPKKERQ